MSRLKYDFFGALVKLGEYASDEAKMLLEVLQHYDPDKVLEYVSAIHEIENAADVQTHQIFTHIATEFLTPIDREDIAEITLFLDDIVDNIDDVAQQLYMFDIQKIHPPSIEMAEIIVQATAALLDVLKEFLNFKRSKTLSGYIIIVNDLEEEADRIYSRTIRDLYKNYVETPVFIMAWSNLFQCLERCIDACENVTDRLATAVLKNT